MVLALPATAGGGGVGEETGRVLEVEQKIV